MNPFGGDYNANLRAYLQRSEVRLSTMHRVAGALLGGAGLLVLVPVLLRDSLPKLLDTILADQQLSAWDQGLLIASLGILVFLPLFFILNLIRDLVHFYFVSDHATTKGRVPASFLPLFVLSTLTPPGPGSERFFQNMPNYEESLLPFVLGPRAGTQYRKLRDVTRFGIVPKSVRQRARDAESDNEKLSDYLTALGLAGYAERTTEEEAAKMVVSLTRHSIYLRRLLIRYLKSLALSVWIFVALLTTSSLAESASFTEPERIAVVTIGIIVAAVFSPFVAHLPIVFAFEITDANLPFITPPDSHMARLEITVLAVTAIAVALASWPLADVTQLFEAGQWANFGGILLMAIAALGGLRWLGSQLTYGFLTRQ